MEVWPHGNLSEGCGTSVLCQMMHNPNNLQIYVSPLFWAVVRKESMCICLLKLKQKQRNLVYFRDLFSVDWKRKSSTSLLPTDSVLGNTKYETKSPCGSFPLERSCEDSSGEKRHLLQILKQEIGHWLLSFFRRNSSTADKDTVWPGDKTWSYDNKERSQKELGSGD